MNSTSYMATPIVEVNDVITFERSGFREIHAFKTFECADSVGTTLRDQHSSS